MQIKELIKISITPEGQVSFVAIQMLCNCFAIKLGILDDNLDEYLNVMERIQYKQRRLAGGADVSESENHTDERTDPEPQTDTEQPTDTDAQTGTETEQVEMGVAETQQDNAEGTAETGNQEAETLVEIETVEENRQEDPKADDDEQQTPTNETLIEPINPPQPDEPGAVDNLTAASHQEFTPIADTSEQLEIPAPTESNAEPNAEATELPEPHQVHSNLSVVGSPFEWNLFGDTTSEQELFTLIQQKVRAHQSSAENLADIIMHARSIPHGNVLLHRIRMCKAFDVIFVAFRELAKHFIDEYEKNARETEAENLNRLVDGIKDACQMNYQQLNDDLNQLRREQLAYSISSSNFGSSEVLLEFQTGLFAKTSIKTHQPHVTENVWTAINSLRENLHKMCNKLNNVEYELTAKTLIQDRANVDALQDKIRKIEKYIRGDETVTTAQTKRINELQQKIEELSAIVAANALNILTRDEVMDLLNRKVEYQHLKNKVSRDELLLIQQLLDNRVYECREIMNRNERNVIGVIDKLSEVVSQNEAHKWLQPLRNEFQEEIAKSRDYLIQKFTSKGECKTLMARNTVLHNVKCLACGTTCMMQSDMDEIMPTMPQLRKTQTTAPVIAYEVGNMRDQDRMGYALVDHLDEQKISPATALKKPCTKCPALHVNSVKSSCCHQPGTQNVKNRNASAAKPNNKSSCTNVKADNSAAQRPTASTATKTTSRDSRKRVDFMLQGTKAK